jgi:hypothetical protein
VDIVYNIVRHMWCKQDRPLNAAILQDDAPWYGQAPMEHFLKHRNVPYDVISSAAFGSKTDLSGYDYMIISGAQDNAFYVALQNNAGWIEDWIEAGGVLLFNSSTFSASWPTGLFLPTGVTETYAPVDALQVIQPTNPVLTYPYDVANAAYFDGWNDTIHGYLTAYNDGNGGQEVLRDAANHPALVQYDYGLGKVTVQTTTVEYWMGAATGWGGDWFFGENLVSYLPPVLLQLTPDNGNVGDSAASVEADGYNFWYGADTTVTVTDSVAKLDLPVSNVVVDYSDHLTFDLDLTSAPEGVYSVVIETPLGAATLADSFTVVDDDDDDDNDDNDDNDTTDDDDDNDDNDDAVDDDTADDDAVDDDAADDDDDNDAADDDAGGGGDDDDDSGGCGC